MRMFGLDHHILLWKCYTYMTVLCLDATSSINSIDRNFLLKGITELSNSSSSIHQFINSPLSIPLHQSITKISRWMATPQTKPWSAVPPRTFNPQPTPSPSITTDTPSSATKDTEFTQGIHEDAKADIQGRVSRTQSLKNTTSPNTREKPTDHPLKQTGRPSLLLRARRENHRHHAGPLDFRQEGRHRRRFHQRRRGRWYR